MHVENDRIRWLNGEVEKGYKTRESCRKLCGGKAVNFERIMAMAGQLKRWKRKKSCPWVEMCLLTSGSSFFAPN